MDVVAVWHVEVGDVQMRTMAVICSHVCTPHMASHVDARAPIHTSDMSIHTSDMSIHTYRSVTNDSDEPFK